MDTQRALAAPRGLEETVPLVFGADSTQPPRHPILWRPTRMCPACRELYRRRGAQDLDPQRLRARERHSAFWARTKAAGPVLMLRRSFSARATSWRSEGGPQGCQYP